MKALAAVSALFIVLYGGGAVGTEAAPVVEKGDTFEQVVLKLGEPKGRITGGRWTTYYYDRGTVDFLTGRVDRAFLITPEEAREKIAVREKEEEAMRQQAEAERVRLLTAGKAQLEKVLGDKAFAASPPAIQLAYWADFQKQYPGIDVSAPIAEATKRLEVSKEENGKVSELVAMNNRAAEIEARFKQLDADYAASLANWKRTEIDQERAKLSDELAGIKTRLAEMLK